MTRRALCFLPRSIECTAVLATSEMFVRLSNVSIVTKRKKLVRPHSYTTSKIIYRGFLRRRTVGLGRPLLPKILGQADPVGAKSPIFSRSLVAPQP